MTTIQIYDKDADKINVLSGKEGITVATLISQLLKVRKVGQWERDMDEVCYWYQCSACGAKVSKDEWGHDYFSSFCPKCGARMIGEVDYGKEIEDQCNS